MDAVAIDAVIKEARRAREWGDSVRVDAVEEARLAPTPERLLALVRGATVSARTAALEESRELWPAVPVWQTLSAWLAAVTRATGERPEHVPLLRGWDPDDPLAAAHGQGLRLAKAYYAWRDGARLDSRGDR